jgi:tetratricopeptide (TPR) repeat protein
MFRRARLLAVLACLLCAAAARPGAQQDSDPAHRASRQAMVSVLAEYLVTFDRADAQRRLAEIVIKDPTYGPALFNLALMYEADADSLTARNYYSHVLQLDVEDRLRAEAERGLQRLATMNGKPIIDYAGMVQQACSFQEAGLSVFAIARAIDAVQVSPDRWEAYAVAADGLEARGDYSASIEMLQSALSRAPEAIKERLRRELARLQASQRIQPLIVAANAAFGERKYSEAADRFKEAWLKHPERVQFGLAAANSYILASRGEDARQIITTIRTRDHSIEVQRAVGQLLEKLR